MQPATPTPRAAHDPDQRVFLRGLSWAEFEAFLAMRGDDGPRVTYWEGSLELMSPSRGHERLKSMLGRLLEAYAEERDLRLDAYGSWLLEKRSTECGIEPDECYVLGGHDADVPDLAIEVVWTSGGLDKLTAYRSLGVREVWFWRDGRVEIHVLRGRRYQPGRASHLLPDLDLELLTRFLDAADQTSAVKAYRRALRSHGD